MGMFRRAQEEHDRGYSSNGNTTVCTSCFHEYGIKKFIKENGQYTNCSYCGSNDDKVIACELDLLIEYILFCIHSEWGDPNQEGVLWEGREGGWQVFKIHDTLDLLIDAGVGNCEPKVFKDIFGSIYNNEWCEKHPYSLRLNESLLYGWQGFSDFVKTEVRYF